MHCSRVQPGQAKNIAAVYERLGNACKELQRLDIQNATAPAAKKEQRLR
eukprot:SAG31_NODE_1992_length_6709_cov_3.654870_9_plen_49_part_00